MSEKTDKKEKPKTTLIKQKKAVKTSDDKDESTKPDKKKIVVVKKKVVKVTKKVVKSDKKEKYESKDRDAVKRKDNRFEPDNKEKSRYEKRDFHAKTNYTNRLKTGDKKTGETGTYRKRNFKSDKDDTRNKTGNYTDKRYQSNKQNKTTQTGDHFAKDKSQGLTEKKQSGRKFFKTKKKDGNYQKRNKEEKFEKIIQQKKKSHQTTNPIPKSISIMEVITISELAKKMNIKASELIAKLITMGMMVTINQQIDAETATILADEYGCKVNIVSLYDEIVIENEEDKEGDLKPRPPIVTVMGHVDHGKTKLLDAIRTADVVASEFGGITQHIGAYTVNIPKGTVVFLDTPGHEAFTKMRARGAQITDLVILVVAANDGVMPQTIEAIDHSKAADVPILIAINKIDLPDANVEKVKKQLSDYGLIPEEWGGHNLFNEISALKKEGIQALLDNILLTAEMLELSANYNCRAQGTILESKIDMGRGIVATVLVQRGTLRVGDSFVAGIYPGKIRAMFNDKGEKVKEVTPGLPVEIIGLSGVPDSGDPFQVTDNEKTAKIIGTKRQELKKLEESRNIKKVTLDNLYDKIKEGEVKELKVIIKGDVHGSVEALKNSLEKLSTSEIKLTVISALAGAINEGDVNLAAASDAIVIGFHVRPTQNAQTVAEREKVEIRKYNIIYDAIEDIKNAMEGLLSPELREEVIGTAEVRQLFKVPKIGTIAGCFVLSGRIKRNAEVHIIRDGIEIYKSKINSLKRFKDDAREVEKDFECGIGVENFNDLKEKDVIEAFEVRQIAKKLKKENSDNERNKTKEN
ncbi:MAG: translation initiation factor IF-2 [Spirochaetales bacterium]|nr:translation initiation factor IF-2 [Spirochaetales bacterium]